MGSSFQIGERPNRVLRAAVAFLALLYSHVACAQFVQVPISGLPGTTAGSIAWGDYDRDGKLDFVLSGSLTISLWHNTGSGFTNVTAAVAPGLPGLYAGSVAWGDYDNDGRLDLLITGMTNFSGGAVSQIWRNTGTAFTNVPIPGLAGVANSSAAWGDVDGDGRLDFLITGTSNGVSSGSISQLWRNTGTGFVNVPIPSLAGVYFGSLAEADFDNDGRLDFLIAGITNSANGDSICQLWRNTGSSFTNVAIPGLRGVYSSSVAWGDYDNDGRPDFLVTGLAGGTFITELWRNTGSGFTNVPVPGLPSVADGSVAWADYDNDGWLDFLVTGLARDGAEISQLWRNTGAGFTNLPIPGLPGCFQDALAWGDYDNDGRVDFLLAGTIQGAIVSQLWRNTEAVSNSPPAAPIGLKATVLGGSVRLDWSAPPDDHTPAAALTYNVRMGTTPGGVDIISPGADPDAGWRRVAGFGNVGETPSATVGLSPGTYFWSVQAVDSGFRGSVFSREEQFTVGLRLEGVRQEDGSFALNFAAPPGATFTALGSGTPSGSPDEWTVLGAAAEISPGRFQFTDFTATNRPWRFYRIRSP